MMHSIPAAGARPPGEPPGAPPSAGAQPLTPQQRTVLERLITRIVALSQAQRAEVWAGMKHDLGIKNDQPLLSRHFPAAEQNLNQRLNGAQERHAVRQTLQQLTELLQHGNNRQAVSDYIRSQFGQTVLSQLTHEQIKSVLTLLQNNQLEIPQPQQRPATDRPMQPAEHNALNQLVGKLAAATGESSKLIWQSMLELTGVKGGETLPARHYTLLTTWLTARLTLAQQPAPTLQTIQTVLKQPLESSEWREITEYAEQRHQATPQTVLTAPQVQDILNHLFLRRLERATSSAPVQPEHVQPIWAPFVPVIEQLKTLSNRPALGLVALLLFIALMWILF